MSTTQQTNDDMIGQLASSLVTTSVVEAMKRAHVSRTGHSANPEQVDSYVREVSTYLEDQCASLEEDARIGYAPTPIQTLKTKLDGWYADFYNMIVDQVRDEVLAEVKDSLKMELRMELFTELKSMTENLPKDAPKQRPAPDRGFNPGSISLLDTELGGGVEMPVGGFESVSKHFTFGNKSSKTPAQIEAELMNSNPLFARINKSISRAKEGLAAYTPEELIEIRRERSGGALTIDDEERLRARMDLSNFSMPEEEDPEDSAKWDELFAAKYNVHSR